MNGALLEVFLGYCEEKGINIQSKGSQCLNMNIDIKDYKYYKKGKDFIIKSDKDGILKIPDIENWQIQEYDDYIKIWNDDIDIYIEELI